MVKRDPAPVASAADVEPNDEDQINGMRRLIDAAIEQARKKENGNVR